jgi:type II secretory pathway pseudopilin PulG
MNNKGFALIEIATVILIIGLLVGSVIAGQSLIKSAQLKAVITEMQNIATASYGFRDQFGYWPGDYPDAHKTWGCGNGIATAGGCNGDGSGYVSANIWNAGNEVHRAHQHLSLANMLEGKFNGSGATTDFPKSKFTGGMYMIHSTQVFDKNTDSHVSVFFGTYNASSLNVTNKVLMPIDARSIDYKIDDGIANSGMLYAVDGINAIANSCSKPASDANGSDYNNLSGKEPTCALNYFIQKF